MFVPLVDSLGYKGGARGGSGVEKRGVASAKVIRAGHYHH